MAKATPEPQNDTPEAEKPVESQPATSETPAEAAAPPSAPMEHPLITGFAHPPRHKKRLVSLIVLSLLVIAAGGVAGYVIVSHQLATGDQTVPPKTQSSTKKPQAAAPTDPLLAKFSTPTTGETWLSTPKQVADLGYVDESGGSEVDYYQVGARGQNIIYMSITQELGLFTMLYEKAPDGTVRAVLQPNANETYSSDYNDQVKQALIKNVIPDTSIHYDSLTLPDGFSIGNNETVTPAAGGYLEVGSLIGQQTDSNSGTTKTVLQTFGGSKLVKIATAYSDTKLTSVSYAIDLPTGTELALSYAPLGTDLSKFTWNNGVTVPASTPADDTSLSAVTRGCSAVNGLATQDNAAQDSDFVAAGKSDSGQTVYAFASSSDPFVSKMYGEYQDEYSGDSQVTIVSLSEFMNQHALVAYKSPNNGWLVYVRTDYAEIGGCAKPVVYLYPTHAEQVTVRLGATVTKSDPFYDPSTGWSVYARPNGQLSVGGQTYGSLFWEGQGTGAYPGITAGTVVKRADALSTIKTQLQQQGLTRGEMADFVAYWKDKIPNKPYVRLTWFNTAQMNQLAPLYVSPKPNTVIRVFLDMDGFTVPPELAPQHLASIPRRGFTVIEWGGLSESALR